MYVLTVARGTNGGRVSRQDLEIAAGSVWALLGDT